MSNADILFVAELDDQGVVRGLRRIEDEVHDLGRTVRGASRDVDRMGRELIDLRAVVSGIGLAVAIREAVDVSAGIVGIAADFEVLGISMRTAFRGSEQAARAATEWIKQAAIDMPLEIDEVTSSFLQLQNAGLDPTTGALQSLVDASSKAGGGSERLTSIVSATSKAYTVGKMSMEEMRMMMERGVPVIDLLGRALGVSREQVLELSQAGRLGRDEIKLLLDEMGRWGEGASAALMESLPGKISNLQDAWASAANTFASAGLTDAVKDALQGIIDKLGELEGDGTLARLGEQVGGLAQQAAERLPELLDRIDEVVQLLKKVLPFARTAAVALGAVWTIQKARSFLDLLGQLPGKAAKAGASAGHLERIGGALTAAYVAGETLANLLDLLNQDHLEAASNERWSREREEIVAWRHALDEAGVSVEQLAREISMMPDLVDVGQMAMGDRMPVSQPLLEHIRELSASADEWARVVDAYRSRLTEALATGRELTESEQALAFALTEVTRQRDAAAEAAAAEAERRERAKELVAEITLGLEQLRREMEASAGATEGLADAQSQADREAEALRGRLLELEEQAAANELHYQRMSTTLDAAMQSSQGSVSSFQRWVEQHPLEIPVGLEAPPISELESELADSITVALSDAVLLAFTGRCDEISEAWQEMLTSWSSWASDSLGEMLREAYTRSRRPGGGLDLGGLVDGTLGDAGFWQSAGLALGTGFMAQATESGSILEGMLSGALTGGAATGWGNVWGYVGGAIVGGVMAAFGSAGEEDPETTWGIEPWGATVRTRGHQGLSPEDWERWQSQAMSSYWSSFMAVRDVLQLGGDASAFDAVARALPSLSSGGWQEASADSLLSWLQGNEIPRQMLEHFRPGFDQLLANLGVSGDSVTDLFGEMTDLPGQDRLQALADFITAARGAAEILSEGSFDSIRGEVLKDSTTLLLEGLQGIGEQMDVVTAGWDDLRLIDRAREFQDLQDAMAQAGQSVGQLIGQLESLRTSLDRRIDSQLEQLELTRMSDTERRDHYRGRIEELMAQLETAGSAEEIDWLSSQIMQYASSLQSLFGDDLWTAWSGASGEDPWAGPRSSVGEWLQQVLGDLREVKDERIDTVQDRARDAYDELIERIASAAEGLGLLGDWLDDTFGGGDRTGDGGTGTGDGSGGGTGGGGDAGEGDAGTGDEGTGDTGGTGGGANGLFRDYSDLWDPDLWQVLGQSAAPIPPAFDEITASCTSLPEAFRTISAESDTLASVLGRLGDAAARSEAMATQEVLMSFEPHIDVTVHATGGGSLTVTDVQVIAERVTRATLRRVLRRSGSGLGA